MALAVAEAEAEGELGWAALAPGAAMAPGTALVKAPALATRAIGTLAFEAPAMATNAMATTAAAPSHANSAPVVPTAAPSHANSAPVVPSEAVANALAAALFGTTPASGAVTGASSESAEAHEHLLVWLETISLTPPGSDEGSDGGFLEDRFSDANDALSEAAMRRHSASYSAGYRHGEGSGGTEEDGGEGCSEGGYGEGRSCEGGDDEQWSLPQLLSQSEGFVNDEQWSLPQLLSQSEGFAARGARSLRSSKELFLPLHALSRSSEGRRASSRASSEPDPWKEAEYDPNLEAYDPNLEAYDPWAGDMGSGSGGSRQRSAVPSSQRGSSHLDTGPLSARHSARSGGSTARSSGEISSGEISVLSTYSSVSSSISLGRVGGAHSHPFGIRAIQRPRGIPRLGEMSDTRPPRTPGGAGVSGSGVNGAPWRAPRLEPSEAAASGLAISYAIELAGIVARRHLAAEEAEEAAIARSELDSAVTSARYSAALSEVGSAASSEGGCSAWEGDSQDSVRRGCL